MSVASYRLHRPKDFASFIGQDHVLAALKGALAGTGSMQHAYLFAGPRGAGKTSLARIYARALQCERREQMKPDQLPCNECDSCVAHLEGRHPDIVEIDAATNSGVEQIRARVIAPAAYHPLLARWRVFIIDEAHILSAAATAALLKTLEEPPEHLVFIFCSTDTHRIPITLRDRCWQFTLAPGTVDELVALLVRVAPWIDAKAASMIARVSAGSYRNALTMLDTMASAHGQQWGPEQVVGSLRLASAEQLRQLYEALGAQDAVRVSETLDQMNERMLDVHALILQLQRDCHRGLLSHYGRDIGDDPALVLTTARLQLKAWQHLTECERLLNTDSQLALSMAVLGLLHL